MPAKTCNTTTEACFIIVLVKLDEKGEEMIGARKVVQPGRWKNDSLATQAKNIMKKANKGRKDLRFDVMTVDDFEAKYGIPAFSLRSKHSPGGTCNDDLKTCKSDKSAIIQMELGLLTTSKNILLSSRGCLSDAVYERLLKNILEWQDRISEAKSKSK